MKTITKTTVSTEPKLVIEYDEDTTSPREWSNLGYFITVDSRYRSPDRHERLENIVKNSGECARDQKDHIRLITENYNDIDDAILAIYPICKYEHSGVSYSLGTKHNFDYSNNGFYIITKRTQKEIGAKKKDYESIIKNELEVFNKYANGECYRFTLYDEKGEVEDSCSGFYDIEDIRDHLPKEWKDENLLDYLK